MERIGPWAVVAVDHAFRGVAGGGMANGGGGVEGLDGWREAAQERIGSRSSTARIFEDLNARSGVRDGGCISRRFGGWKFVRLRRTITP